MNVEQDAVSSLTDLARQSVVPLNTEKMAHGLGAVRARLADRRRQRNRRVRSLMAAALAVLVFAGAKTVPHLLQPPALTYAAQGGQIVEGGYLRSDEGEHLVLRFDEGSELNFPAGTRGRLRMVDHHGATVALEQGTVDVKVVHRPHARWLIEAGPFQIHVLGTSFDVGWDSASESLDLHMRQGLVSVSGPLAEGAISVRAGQRLAVSLPGKKVVLQDVGTHLSEGASPSADMGKSDTGTSARPAPVAPAEAPVHAPALAPSSTSHASTRVPSPTGPKWAATVAEGKWDLILKETERRGLQAILTAASGEDLAALADAARYGRRDDIARQALMAQRRRFPGSPRAHEAGFQLGRLDEASGSERGALAWYEAYLAEAPQGSFAAEALGRKMVTTRRIMGSRAARTLAEDYLRRFPDGTYAGAARAIQQAP
jgi:TolA-binding protein